MNVVSWSSTLRTVCRTAGAAVAVAGCLVLAGWALDTPALKGLFPGMAAVPPLTAWGFLFAGASLWLSQSGPREPAGRHARLVAFAAAALVVLIGALTLLASIVGRGSAIDRLLFRGVLGAGRITPDAGLSLFLLGCALMLLEEDGRGSARLAEFLALMTAAVTLLVLTAYLYGVRVFHGAISDVLMPPQAALVFAVLSAGILCARPSRGVSEILTSESTGGSAARRLVPSAVGVLLLVGLAALAGQKSGLYDAPFGFSLLVVVSAVIIVVLVWWSARSLTNAESERRQTEEELREANSQLAGWVGELEQRDSEINRLGEVGNLLQSCVTPHEVYRVVATAAELLFPARPGALYVLTPPGDLLDTVAVWGEPAPSVAFRPEECWALRRGRPHVVDDTSAGLTCLHLTEPLPDGYMCVPMLAQGTALGVLHLRIGPRGRVGHDESPGRLLESEQRLAETVADQVALALANLRLRETLRAQSIRDPLTGVFNRRYMEESLERELRRAARRGYPVSVITLDVDHFTRVNETAGRDAGDALLRVLGEFLRTRIRKEDIACRFGGGEFTLILPEAPLDVACQRAEALRDGFKRLDVSHHGQPLRDASLSLGVAVAPQHGATTEALLRSAGEALRRAKTGGRDRVMTAA